MENGSLQHELKKLESTVDDIKEQLSEVHSAIVGNPLSKDGGMAQRLTDAEKQLEKLELRIEAAELKQVKYNTRTAIMWVCLGGSAMALFTYILQLLFHK